MFKILRKYLLSVFFLIAALVNFYYYIDAKETIKNTNPIKYNIVESSESYASRSPSHQLKLVYKNAYYEVPINGQIYDEVNNGVFPDFYYSVRSNRIICYIQIGKGFNAGIVFLGFFIFFLLPINEWLDSMDRRDKA